MYLFIIRLYILLPTSKLSCMYIIWSDLSTHVVGDADLVSEKKFTGSATGSLPAKKQTRSGAKTAKPVVKTPVSRAGIFSPITLFAHAIAGPGLAYYQYQSDQ